MDGLDQDDPATWRSGSSSARTFGTKVPALWIS